MNRLPFRPCLPMALLIFSSAAAAVGLGELRGQPDLGERLRVEIDVLGAERLGLETGCFRLVSPAGGGELPVLRAAALEYRSSPKPILLVRSHAPVREPILQLAVQVGCGHEVSREYTVLASPAREVSGALPAARVVAQAAAVAESSIRKAPRVRPVAPQPVDPPAQLAPKKIAKPAVAVRLLQDRLLLSDGGDVGEPSLRVAGELLSWKGELPDREAQREVLRLEFRMLMALQEQATSQLATAEKLRNMEATLSELQQRAGAFAQKLEKSPASEQSPVATGPTPALESKSSPESAGLPTAKAPVAKSPVEDDWFTEWRLYGLILGALLGVIGWLGWRNHKERQTRLIEDAYDRQSALAEVDPPRSEEWDEPGGVVDLHVEPSAMGAPMSVDLELDGGHDIEQLAKLPVSPSAPSADSVFSISNATVDEHFEANPVMELADIMLSFGRVKGAAQALQEYIDNNPQEALQPWIRLMDVYRMAGMRDEFERVAANLNQHFNVEVLSWGASDNRTDVDIDLGKPDAPRPQSLEDMPRLMSMVVELWFKGDVVAYLHQLLRDNRGGQRLGFTLPVVEDILFLIELKETANRMETAK